MTWRFCVLGLIVVWLLGVGPWAPGHAALAQDCEAHTPPDDGSLDAYSSPVLHKRHEGLLIPLASPSPVRPRLESYTIDAEADFFSCMVRNFIINVQAEFLLARWEVAEPDQRGQDKQPMRPLAAELDDLYQPRYAFPITTHALYGDHNLFREIHVAVDGAEIPYRVAMDYSAFQIVEDPPGWTQLYYKGRLINYEVHPYLEEAVDLNQVAPHLVEQGFDLVIFFGVPSTDSASLARFRKVVVTYTSNSDDFSSCCDEVAMPTHSPNPYMFYFDLTNTRFWGGPLRGTVILRNSDAALWSAVPDLPLEIAYTPDTIILKGTGQMENDLAVPAQPSVFTVWPRNWPEDQPQQ